MQRQVTRDNWSSEYPALSPDGRQVACAGYRDGRQALFLIDALTGARRVLVGGLVNIGESAWSPDGKRIAFRAGRQANNAIFVVNANGSGLRALTPDINYFSPAWSPDGGTIAYVALEYQGSQPRQFIKFLNFSTNATRSVVLPFVGDFAGNGFFVSGLDWSANGAYMVMQVLSRASSASSIYRIAPNGSGLRQLTAGTRSNPDYYPSISPDSRSVLFAHFTRQGYQLRVMNADGTG
jgi:Tol biopolymer transport system component